MMKFSTSSPPTTSKTGNKEPTLELSFRAIVLGLILSVVMGAANVYLGLKVGMTVTASIPAAVLAMLFLKGLKPKGTILEANQVQTAASAGESLAAGIIFTMPALVMIGVWKEFDVFTTSVIAITGGLLGILFMIPLRKVFITGKYGSLPYPEAQACVAVLEAGQNIDTSSSDSSTRSHAMGIVYGTLIGGAYKALISFVGLMKGTLETATILSGKVFYFGSDISAALLGIGFIVRLNVSILVFIGGSLAWLIGIPLLGRGDEFTSGAIDGAWTLWSTQIRYLGVGAMIMGGIFSIIGVRSSLAQAVKELAQRLKEKGPKQTNSAVDNLDRDISSRMIFITLIAATVGIVVTYYRFTQDPAITVITSLLMFIMSFFMTAVASYIVGLVGNSNSPVSGMTITAVLVTGLLLYVLGYSGTEGMVATLGVAAIVCCAACTSGDVCNDLKTGHLVGASPFRQQIMQIMGVVVAGLVMAPVLNLLHQNTPGGIGGRELAAPQAGLFANLARGIFGNGHIPWNMVMIGSVLGIVIHVIDMMLEKKKSNFRLYLMPMAVGMYLPFGVSIPMLIGGIMASILARGAKDENEEEGRLRHGTLFASGLIAGESLMGVGLALLASFGIKRLNLGMSDASLDISTLVLSGLLIAFFVWTSRPSVKKAQ